MLVWKAAVGFDVGNRRTGVVFFFQAEDGIRDSSVTGVQTCALPISSPIGTSLAHVYNNGAYHVDIFDPNDPVDITPFAIDTFSLTPNAVPEPSSWLLLGTGILPFATAAVTPNLIPRSQ